MQEVSQFGNLSSNVFANRFWSKVNKRGPIPQNLPHLGPCWLWTASCDPKGYGLFYFPPLMNAHRASFKIRHGYLPPPEIDLDHQCNTPLCVNPDHLKPMTHRENMARHPKFPGNRTHCARGHEFNQENTYNYLGKDGFMRRQCRICKRTRKGASQ